MPVWRGRDVSTGRSFGGLANAIDLAAACHVLERPLAAARRHGILSEVEVLVIADTRA